MDGFTIADIVLYTMQHVKKTANDKRQLHISERLKLETYIWHTNRQ